MNAHQNQPIPSPTFKRKREVLACHQCGWEKTICDGHPCASCGDKSVICDGQDCGHHGGGIDRGYVEWLEGERRILSLGVQEACRRLIAANLWPREALPRVGRSLSTYEMLVTLGLVQSNGNKNVDQTRVGNEASSTQKAASPVITRPATRQHQPFEGNRGNQVTGSTNPAIPHEEQNRGPFLPLLQPPVATPLRKSSANDHLARHSWLDTALVIPHDHTYNTRTIDSAQGEQLWRYTTDAYQDVSGPSDLNTRAYSLLSRTTGDQGRENTTQRASGNLSATLEAGPGNTSGFPQEETPPENDDQNEYIKIPF